MPHTMENDMNGDDRDTSDASATVPEPYPSIIDFYRESEYARFDQKHRRGGTFGIEMIEVAQGEIDTTEPAAAQVQFAAFKVQTPMPWEFDVGDGWRPLRATSRSLALQPALQACGLRLPALDLCLTAIDKTRLDGLLAEVDARSNALDVIAGTCVELPRARHLLDAMWESTGGTGAPADTLRTDGLFMTFVGELLEACGSGRLESCLPSLTDPRLVRAVDYVESYLEQALSVGELACVATMSTSGFARAFRAVTGEPVWAYVQRRRSERARELLVDSALPIDEVARRCGFATSSHLTRVFKSYYGVTPGAARH